MITVLIIALIAALGYSLWRIDKSQAKDTSKETITKIAPWILVGILSVLALFHPKIRERINDLRQRHGLK